MALAIMLSGLMSIGSAAAATQSAASTHAGVDESSQTGQASSNASSPAPPGFPGGSDVADIGNSMVQAVESSAQFQELAGGLAYHVDQSRSFGYTWGANIASTERILFFSPNGSGQIEADIYVTNGTIQQLSFANVTLANNVRY